jgi:predicted RNA-binding protein with PUA-like domain
MQEGDLSFFYHSNEGLAVVGVMRIVRPFYLDPSDATGRYGMVDVEAVKPLATPVTLAAIKAEPKLADLALVRQSRLSVMPVAAADWRLICKMGGIAP